MRRACLLATLAVLAIPAPAVAQDAFLQIFVEYQQTGKVDGCKWTAKQLKDAKGQVPNDIEQYAPDFPAALDAAARRRAQGGCKSGSTPSGGQTTTTTTGTTTATVTPTVTASTGPTGPTSAAGGIPPATSTPQPTPDPLPSAAATDTAIPAALASDEDDPGAAWLLIALAALLLLTALMFALARWRAWEPAGLVRWRHATAEAGWRVGGAWSDFRDWLRIGR